MSHFGLLTGLAPDVDEDGAPASTADFTARECEQHGEYRRPDHATQGCPECGQIGAQL